MAKLKYYYNSETCDYEPVKPKKRHFLLKTGLYLTLASIVAATALFYLAQNFGTPKENRLLASIDEFQIKWNLLEREFEGLSAHLGELQINDENMREILEIASLSEEIRNAGIGGNLRHEDLRALSVDHQSMIVEAYQKMDKLKAQLLIQERSLDTLDQYALNRDIFWASIPAIQPVENKTLRRLSTVYGMRMNPVLKKMMPHKGLDFMGNTGLPVYATGDGTIELARMTKGGFGNLITINHGYGYKTRYAHLNAFNVGRGEKVTRGQLIGFMGNTGRSAGVHLHYEVLKDRRQVNPIGFFQRELGDAAYAKLLAMSRQKTIPLD